MVPKVHKVVGRKMQLNVKNKTVSTGSVKNENLLLRESI